MRILLVDDDDTLMESLAERLIQQRYAVDIAVDGETAQTYVDLFNYDLIVLDLMLPDGDGIEFCQTFRQMGYSNPLMILTAKESTAQKVKALDAGADDYVVKPFDFDELCARIRALLRRENQGLPTVLEWGALSLDPSTCETTYHDQLIRLTPKEFSLMELFLRNPHRVYSLSAIIDDLWSFESPPGEDAVRTHIKGLRRKLQTAGAPKDLIKTVYGLGYRLNESTHQPKEGTKQTKTTETTKQEEQKQQTRPAVETDVHTMVATKAELEEQLAQACRRYLRSASQQIAALEKAATKLNTAAKTKTEIDSELYKESYANAHKLAGSLGSYGIPEGSKTARLIEKKLNELSFPFEISVAMATQIEQWIKQLRQQIDQATVQAVVAAASAAMQESTPLVLMISPETTFVQQLESLARSTHLQIQSVTSPQQAMELLTVSDTALLDLLLPDLLLIDVGHAASECAEVLPLVETVKQHYKMPVMVLGEQISLEHRLQLVKQGVEVVTDRALNPQQIMAITAELVTAETSQVRIAIADDDPHMRSLLKSTLAPWGFQVTTFASATDLWHWLSIATSAVDMIVLDVEMPGVDGIEICQVIRADARFQSVPILFLSQHQEDALRMKAFQSGADDFINKAIAPIDLATRLRNQLGKACRLYTHPPSNSPSSSPANSARPDSADSSLIRAQTSV